MASLTMQQLEVLSRLAATIDARKGSDPGESYSARLLADPKLAARKVGEEAGEVVVAALTETPDDLAREAADLVYHLMVLLAAHGTSLGAVLDELEHREGTSGLVEKAARGTA